MDRRSFLRGALGAAVGIVAAAPLVEALTPKRTIFLPPRGGWTTNSAPLQSFHFQTHAQYAARSNAGVPQFLTNYVDPKIIDVLVSPMKMSILYGISNTRGLGVLNS